jgi:molybdopterin-containing oxidoreductase family iron-sulfur binding subunit
MDDPQTRRAPLSRRGFLKAAGAGAAALAAASAARTALAKGPHPGDPGAGNQRWVMVIDLARCDGCGDCTEACTAMHVVPEGQEWIKVYEVGHGETSNSHATFFPRPCMQCDNPPCVNVCPVGASYKREDGIVLIDQNLCIGCRFCMAACPYSARYFNWAEPPHTAQELSQPYSVETNLPHRRGVAEKCLFCPALTRQGQLPACVSACEMGALFFGDEHEDAVTNSLGETYRLSKLLAEGAAHRHLEELGTEPRVWYLPPRKWEVTSDE